MPSNISKSEERERKRRYRQIRGLQENISHQEKERVRMKERRSKQTEEEKQSERDIARVAMAKFRAASKEGVEKAPKLRRYNEREENKKKNQKNKRK